MSKVTKFNKTFTILLEILDKVKSLKGGKLWYVDEQGEGYELVEEYSRDVEEVVAETRKFYKSTLGFVQVYQEQEKEICRDLSGSALKVLCLLRSYLKFGNKVYGLTNKFMAEYLKMTERTISRSLKELQDKKLIIFMGKKHTRVIKINPANASKGKFNQSKYALNQFKI